MTEDDHAKIASAMREVTDAIDALEAVLLAAGVKPMDRTDASVMRAACEYLYGEALGKRRGPG